MSDSGDLSPSWAEIIRAAMEARIAELHTGLPAYVVTFYADKQQADVRPHLFRSVLDDDGVPRLIDPPLIRSVPVVFEAGGGWCLTYPLVRGDVVHLAFAERSLDKWSESAPTQWVDPLDTRKHDLSDAIAFPGLRQTRNPLPVHATDLRIGRSDGSDPGIVLKPDGTIEIGQGGTQSMVLGNALQTVIQALVTSLIGEFVASPSGPPNTWSQAPTIMATFSTALSPKGKVK